MRKYDEEFKINAVKKIFDGQTVASLSRELGVAENLLHTAVGKKRNLSRVRDRTKRFWNLKRSYAKWKWRMKS